ncbi:hypothetical protein [Flammeovirga sp. EKP202]|uniref:hypothetical protein n=1 Tax=Flammeovirga sp. EKP202 TaxID=2770592 RepID=UPI00165F877B|nr:hypothetical protein [Flammeovirga sp. EKP202]MBD0399885.1 hypothetical protein [Flammeovirga sp. EKP202]
MIRRLRDFVNQQNIFSLQLIISLLWISVQWICFQKFNIKEGADSPLYLQAGQDLIEGTFVADRRIWYLGYCLYIAFIKLFTDSITVIAIGQLIIAYCSMILFFRLLFYNFKDQFLAFCGVLMYLGWIPLHEWNFILYTESIFTSLSIITVYLIFKKKYWSGIVIGILCILTRPNGILFLLSFCITLFILQRKTNYKYVFLIAFLFLGLLINEMLAYYGPLMIEGYLLPEIIYFQETLKIKPLDNPYLPSKELGIITQLFLFAFKNFTYFLKISIVKGSLFMTHIKPYYSLSHNLYSILFLYPIYIFAVVGIKKSNLTKVELFGLIYFLLQLFTISITSENWDGRFLPPVLPFVFMLSTKGLKKVFL